MLALENIPLKLKVKNFTLNNVNEVKVQWSSIEDALVQTVDWLVEYGYSGNTLSSKNAVIPIAYYIFNGGNKKSKDDWRRYFSHALIKNLYSSGNDQFLEDLRRELKIINHSSLMNGLVNLLHVTKSLLKKISIVDKVAEEWQNKRDQLPNLQM